VKFPIIGHLNHLKVGDFQTKNRITTCYSLRLNQSSHTKRIVLVGAFKHQKIRKLWGSIIPKHCEIIRKYQLTTPTPRFPSYDAFIDGVAVEEHVHQILWPSPSLHCFVIWTLNSESSGFGYYKQYDIIHIWRFPKVEVHQIVQVMDDGDLAIPNDLRNHHIDKRQTGGYNQTWVYVVLWITHLHRCTKWMILCDFQWRARLMGICSICGHKPYGKSKALTLTVWTRTWISWMWIP
jgi:hypothetical protein